MNARYLIWIVVAGLICPCISFAQNPWNMELVGKAAYDGNLTNYVAYGDYIYVITDKPNIEWNTLTVIDISNPSHPHRVRDMSQDNFRTGLLVMDSLLYVMSGRYSDTLIIYSLDDPAWPQEITRLNLGMSFWRLDRLNENLVGSGSYGGYEIYDFQDRLNPQHVVGIILQYGVTSVQLSGNYLYFSEYASLLHNFLEVFDVSNILNPTSIYFSYLGYGYIPEIRIVGDYMYYLYNVSQGIIVFNIIDPYNPVIIDTVLTDYNVRDLFISGNYAYMVGNFDQLLTIDISDPINPVILNSLYNQGYSWKIYLDENRLLMRSGSDLISYFNITNPVNPVLQGRYLPGSVGWDVSKWGDYAYTANNSGGFNIFNVSDPTDPVGVGYYSTDDQTFKIFTDDGMLYLADGYGGVRIFSLADPLNPDNISNISLESTVYDMYALDSLLYIAYSLGFKIANIANPEDPSIIGEYICGLYSNGYNTIIAYGNYTYTAETDSGFCVYDVSDPTAPLNLGCFGSGVSRDFHIQDSILYIADFQNGLSIFNLDNPALPSHISTTIPNGARSVCVHNNIAYLAYMNYAEGVKLFDLSDLYNPQLIGTYEDYGFCTGVFVENDTAYVSAGNGGLWILRYQAPTDIYDDHHIIPKALSFENYPNPFNASTTIRYSLPNESEISISIYNLLGQRIETIVEGVQEPGEHTITWDASQLPSGIYFARLETRCRTENIKMVLLK